jgi:creatinine amidohydrolase
VAESLIGWGCRRLLFLNGHAGNVPYLSELARRLEATHGVRCAQIDWWRFIQPLVADLTESDVLPHGHASEFGTSVMRHLVPEHVKQDRAVRTEPPPADPFADFLRPGRYRALTATGVLGDGTIGTPEKAPKSCAAPSTGSSPSSRATPSARGRRSEVGGRRSEERGRPPAPS